MTLKIESPAAGGTASGANTKAANFLPQAYRACERFATDFEAIHLAALRAVHLAARHGLTIERAAMVAPLIFGQERQ